TQASSIRVIAPNLQPDRNEQINRALLHILCSPGILQHHPNKVRDFARVSLDQLFKGSGIAADYSLIESLLFRPFLMHCVTLLASASIHRRNVHATVTKNQVRNGAAKSRVLTCIPVSLDVGANSMREIAYLLTQVRGVLLCLPHSKVYLLPME